MYPLKIALTFLTSPMDRVSGSPALLALMSRQAVYNTAFVSPYVLWSHGPEVNMASRASNLSLKTSWTS